MPTAITPERMLEDLQGVPVVTGAIVRVPTFAKAVNVQVTRTIPSGPVVIDRRTDLRMVESDPFAAAGARRCPTKTSAASNAKLARVREIIELPLQATPACSSVSASSPPKGVLLHGPPGTGKTLLARAVAAESRVHFIHLNGPEIMRKFYGESEAQLREVLRRSVDARAGDHLHRRDRRRGAQARRGRRRSRKARSSRQLLGLMDGFVARGQVIVIGATNIPGSPRSGACGVPAGSIAKSRSACRTRRAALQILQIHTAPCRSAPMSGCRTSPITPTVSSAPISKRCARKSA